MPSSHLRFTDFLWITPAAGALGFAQALNVFSGTPDLGLLASAARGICARDGLDGFAPASFFDGLAAQLWTSGGASLLAWGNWGLTWLGWSLVFAVLLAGTSLLIRLFPEKRIKRLLAGAIAVLLVVVSAAAIWQSVKEWSARRLDLRLIIPTELIRAGAGDEAVFANLSAIPWLILLRDGQGHFPSPVDAARLGSDPSAWRAALREKGWSRVVLAGPMSEYRPLLDHLLVSPDWKLVKVANLGWAFERGAGVPEGIPVPADVSLEKDLDTAVYLAQLGERLDAMKRTSEARACITRALELAPKDPTVLSHAASFFAERKRWQEVLTYTDKALKTSPDFVHALLLSALAQYELGDFPRAQDALGKVLMQRPDDFYALLLLARVYRAEHDFRLEAEVLERLARLAGQHRLPQSRYLVYLGQAYAQQGMAERAARSYRRALETKELSAEEVKDVQAALDLVETRSGMRNQR